jgi:hypothetical protein
MRLKLLILPTFCAAIAAAVFGAGNISAKEPGPSAGKVLVSGLLQPRGIAFGSDGMIYVAEAGTGGDTNFEPEPGVVVKNGFTGRISKVNPDTGARTTVADGLPSQASPELGEAVGPADVAFIGSTLYYLQTHGGAGYGFPATPTGIYRIDNSGNAHLVANIGAFNIANPTKAISDGSQADIEVGGNPYAMDVRNGAFYVTDGNHNRLLKVTTGGAVTKIAEFPDHPVSTGLDFGPDNTAYVSYLGKGPFFPEDGKVVKVNLSSGVITELASGQPWLTDVEFGPGGKLYATQFNNVPALSDDAIGPFKGTLLTVDAKSGAMTPLVTGLSFPTFVEFNGNTAYVSNWSVTAMGEIVKIENFSSVRAPAPEPTAAPSQAPAPTATPRGGVIGAPDTGDGSSAAGGGFSSGWLLTLLGLGMAGTALTLVGTRTIARRDP